MITKYKNFLNEGLDNKDEIIKLVTTNSYLDFDQDDNGVLHFSTRENGDVGSEEPGQADIREARRIRMFLLERYDDLEVRVEVIDEWVMLFVKKLEPKVDVYRYIFKKDINNQGFSSSFDTMDELIDKYGKWIKVDWNDIKSEVDKINHFGDNQFNGWVWSAPILIKSVDEPDNDWGYNFYIIKAKEKEYGT